MSEKSPFTKREWLFVIFIIMLVEFIVGSISLFYSKSASALGYISISGTVVSIILAFLAIIYSYYQSASQANSSSSLNGQIEKLISIIDDIKTNKSDFSNELTQLTDIREKIESSFQLQRSSHAQMQELNESVNALRNNDLSGVYSSTNPHDNFDSLIIEGDNSIHITLLIIYYADQAGIEYENIWQTLGSPVINVLHEQKISSEITEYFKGSIFGIISALKALAFIEVTSEKLPITIDDKYEQDFIQFHKFISARDEKLYKEIIATLEKAINEWALLNHI